MATTAALHAPSKRPEKTGLSAPTKYHFCSFAKLAREKSKSGKRAKMVFHRCEKQFHRAELAWRVQSHRGATYRRTFNKIAKICPNLQCTENQNDKRVFAAKKCTSKTRELVTATPTPPRSSDTSVPLMEKSMSSRLIIIVIIRRRYLV